MKRMFYKNLNFNELSALMGELNQPNYRTRQLFQWMYEKLAIDFGEMLNLPRDIREKLRAMGKLISLELVSRKNSISKGTLKLLFSTADGRQIESVIIPEEKRRTLCISTQVGCPLDCKFCATGLMGYKRNLSSGEILDQYILAAREYLPLKISNIVYMGMGEPLLNFDNLIRSLGIFTHSDLSGLSRKRITISTAGIPDRIDELSRTGIRVKLALSLHSCFDDIRSEIMPVNKKFPLNENIKALKNYAKVSGTRITFEYTMMKGINDRNDDVKALVRLCRQLPSKINLIPFNSIRHMNPKGISATLESSTRERIEDFASELRRNNITVMLRNTQGDDIEAACGQLAYQFINQGITA